MIRKEWKIPDVLENCATREAWESKRLKILKQFEENEYGKRPDVEFQVTWKEEIRETIEELDALHIRTNLTVKTALGMYTFPVTAYIPKTEEKVPAVLLICSQQKHPKPMQMPVDIKGKSADEIDGMMSQIFSRFGIVMEDLSQTASMITTPVPLDLDRDYENGHWPVREAMKQKTAVFGFYAGDTEADNSESYPSGLAAVFGTEKTRKQQDWGILAVWAFAASRVMDYMQCIPEVDAAKIAVTGHSRCGKAALWAGAVDERFAAVMPNGSGCCGAALSRGKKGENLASIQAFFPHWFAPEFQKFAGKESELPYDQHFLLAAVAPRLLHVGSGSKDDWADPQGEYYSTVLASKVWELYGGEQLKEEMPCENQQVIRGKVGYHLRKGPHKLDLFDWNCLFEHMHTQSEHF